MDHSGSVCSYCGGCDLREDFCQGNLTCMGCGLVASNIVCSAPSYSSRDNGQPSSVVDRTPFRRQGFVEVRRPKSLPYKRATYFTERLTQWMLRAPPIPEEDERRIFAVWEKYANDAWPDAKEEPPTKERIRCVLDYLDGKLANRNERPRFVRKYLEKWLTLRKDISGYRSWGEFVQDRTQRQMRIFFDQAQAAFDTHIRKNASRHSFLNYNFVMRRILELLGRGWYTVDFPPLKTKLKQRTLVRYWKRICKACDWPYINNDRHMFPDADFFDHYVSKK